MCVKKSMSKEDNNMTQKYIVRKIKRFSGLGRFFFLLYQYSPETDDYCFIGRYATLGQLLSAIGCEEINNWHFLRQQSSPGGHATVNCYNYVKTMGSCSVEVKVDVVEKSETGWARCEEDNQVISKLFPAELHKILFLLHNKRAELQIELEDPRKAINVGSMISSIDEIEFLGRLSAKLSQEMRKWLEAHPDDAYALSQKHDLAGSNIGREHE